METKLDSRWLANIRDPDERKRFRQQIIHNQSVLNRLGELIKDRIEFLEKEQRDRDNYENSSWPYFQADTVGGVRELKQILDFITLTGE